MAKIPFIVGPRLNSRIETLGTDESGKVEIERKGYLTVGEKSLMASAGSQDEIVSLVMTLSRKVAKEFKLGQKEAYEEVVNAITEPEKCTYPVYESYVEEIAELASNMLAAEQKKTLMRAYCMLIFRVNEEIQLEDVLELHEDLIEELANLYLDEENKSVERLLDQDEEQPGENNGEIDEIEKK